MGTSNKMLKARKLFAEQLKFLRALARLRKIPLTVLLSYLLANPGNQSGKWIFLFDIEDSSTENAESRKSQIEKYKFIFYEILIYDLLTTGGKHSALTRQRQQAEKAAAIIEADRELSKQSPGKRVTAKDIAKRVKAQKGIEIRAEYVRKNRTRE